MTGGSHTTRHHLKFISDPHPGFASEVMDEFRKLFGMQPSELAAPREKSKTGTVESRHNLLARVLGQWICERATSRMRSTCRRTARRRRQSTTSRRKGTYRRFECTVGQRPRTARCMSLVCTAEECDSETDEPWILKTERRRRLNPLHENAGYRR